MQDAAPIAAALIHATSRPPLRVLLCAGHKHLLWGLSKLIESEWPRMLVVGAVRTLPEAEQYLRPHRPEAALIELPDVTEKTLKEVERLCRSFRTSFVILDGDAAVRDRLTAGGARAVLPLDAPAERIVAELYQARGSSTDSDG